MKSTILNHRRKARGGSPHAPDAVRQAVGEWYLVAKDLLDQLYHTASRMAGEARKAGSPLGGLLDPAVVESFANYVELASIRLCDTTARTGLVLPDPIAVLRAAKKSA